MNESHPSLKMPIKSVYLFDDRNHHFNLTSGYLSPIDEIIARAPQVPKILRRTDFSCPLDEAVAWVLSAIMRRSAYLTKWDGFHEEKYYSRDIAIEVPLETYVFGHPVNRFARFANWFAGKDINFRIVVNHKPKIYKGQEVFSFYYPKNLREQPFIDKPHLSNEQRGEAKIFLHELWRAYDSNRVKEFLVFLGHPYSMSEGKPLSH